MTDQSVSVPLFALSQPPTEHRPTLPTKLSRRFVIIGLVVLLLVSAAIAVIVLWPRPPKLTTDEYIEMLDTNPLFSEPYVYADGVMFPIHDLTVLPAERVAGILADSGTDRRGGLPGNVSNCPLTELEATLRNSHADASGGLKIGSEMIGAFSIILFDTPEEARIAAQATLQCLLAAGQDIGAHWTITYDPSSPDDLVEVEERGMAIWPITVTWDDWFGEDGTIQLEGASFSEATIAYGNVMVLVQRDLPSESNDLAPPWEAGDPIASALKEAIDAAAG